MHRALATVLVAATAIAEADAPRDAIERARELEAQLAYDDALAIVESAIASGQSDRTRLVELHLLAGRLAAGLDRAQLAEEHFAVVLALDPARTLPEGTSPKLAVPFTVARTKAVPLVVTLAMTAAEVAVEANAALVAGIAVRLADGSTRSEPAATRLARPPGEIVEVRALDRHGNTLWIGSPPRPQTNGAGTGQTTTRVETVRPHVLARWTTWAAVTGVALAAGGVAAWRFSVAQDEFDDRRGDGTTSYSDLQAIEDRGRRWGLAANIGFGVAAATAITSVICLVRAPAEKRVVVTAGAGTIGVAGRF